MQKLKFELVNGYGILVDQEAEIKEGDKFIHPDKTIERASRNLDGRGLSKIIFAEKELNLEGVPVFEWRDFEVEKLAEKYADFSNDHITMSFGDKFNETSKRDFIRGYKSNPAKYTENDLMILSNFIIEFYEYQMENKHFIDKYGFSVDKLDLSDAIYKLIQSLQKCPEYVVMESEEVIVGVTEDGSEYVTELNLKLYNNSEGKQQGTVKEIIWK